ncbi:MAG: YggS family pyridoxal phosphate-dependent enzyme [Planctomycetota bacterium]
MTATDWTQRLHDNVARVRAHIADACARAGRDPAEVRLVGVTKYVSAPVIRELLAAGVQDVGESRVQQLASRALEIGEPLLDWTSAAGPAETRRPRWHMIGHLQRNKVKALLPHARIVHSLDSDRLADTLETHAAALDATVDAFIEVNVAGEASKQGVPPDEVAALATEVRRHPHLRLRGLMTMAPLDPDPEAARPCFARLRELLERLRGTGAVGAECVHLSMGMSQDYRVAVEEGATLVRVGSALFEGLPPDERRTE